MKKKHKSVIKKTTLGTAGLGIGVVASGLTNDEEVNIQNSTSNKTRVDESEEQTFDTDMASETSFVDESTPKAEKKEESKSFLADENDPSLYVDLMAKMQHFKNSIENI